MPSAAPGPNTWSFNDSLRFSISWKIAVEVIGLDTLAIRRRWSVVSAVLPVCLGYAERLRVDRCAVLRDRDRQPRNVVLRHEALHELGHAACSFGVGLVAVGAAQAGRARPTMPALTPKATAAPSSSPASARPACCHPQCIVGRGLIGVHAGDRQATSKSTRPCESAMPPPHAGRPGVGPRLSRDIPAHSGMRVTSRSRLLASRRVARRDASEETWRREAL